MASVLTLARLCKEVYGDGPDDTIEGWKRVQDYGPSQLRLFGLKFDLSGFAAALFRHEARGEHVFAVRGTNQLFWDLIVDDQQIAVGDVPRQFRDAMQAFFQARKESAHTRFYLTGHSLGGGLAMLLAADNELPLVTFNAPGIAGVYRDPIDRFFPLRLRAALRGQIVTWTRRDDRHVMHIRAEHDPVSFLTSPKPGPTRSVPITSCQPPSPGPFLGSCGVPKLSLGHHVQMARAAAQTVKYLLCHHYMDTLIQGLEGIPEMANDLGWISH
jgi:hypothetical protein